MSTISTASSSVTLNNYLDGFRIYNPLGANSDSYTESEKNASYVNVINNLAPVENGKDTLNGIGFITGSLAEAEKLSESQWYEFWKEAQAYPHIKLGMSENPTVFRFKKPDWDKRSGLLSSGNSSIIVPDLNSFKK